MITPVRKLVALDTVWSISATKLLLVIVPDTKTLLMYFLLNCRPFLEFSPESFVVKIMIVKQDEPFKQFTINESTQSF